MPCMWFLRKEFINLILCDIFNCVGAPFWGVITIDEERTDALGELMANTRICLKYFKQKYFLIHQRNSFFGLTESSSYYGTQKESLEILI